MSKIVCHTLSFMTLLSNCNLQFSTKIEFKVYFNLIITQFDYLHQTWKMCQLNIHEALSNNICSIAPHFPSLVSLEIDAYI